MIKKWNSLSLVIRICIGLVIGAVLGLVAPGMTWIAVLGKLFVGALKAIAPFGILGLVFDAVSSSGLEIFTTYGELVLVLVVTMLIVAFVVNPLIVGITLRHNPFPLIFKCVRQSGVTAFFTRSSAANIPVNMALLLSIVSTFSACGTSGVAGGSLLLVPLACSLFGISNDVAMQIVGVGFIVSVIQDSLETALNSSGDVIFTATAEFLEWEKQGKELPIWYEKHKKCL